MVHYSCNNTNVLDLESLASAPCQVGEWHRPRIISHAEMLRACTAVAITLRPCLSEAPSSSDLHDQEQLPKFGGFQLRDAQLYWAAFCALGKKSDERSSHLDLLCESGGTYETLKSKGTELLAQSIPQNFENVFLGAKQDTDKWGYKRFSEHLSVSLTEEGFFSLGYFDTGFPQSKGIPRLTYQLPFPHRDLETVRLVGSIQSVHYPRDVHALVFSSSRALFGVDAHGAPSPMGTWVFGEYSLKEIEEIEDRTSDGAAKRETEHFRNAGKIQAELIARSPHFAKQSLPLLETRRSMEATILQNKAELELWGSSPEAAATGLYYAQVMADSYGDVAFPYRGKYLGVCSDHYGIMEGQRGTGHRTYGLFDLSSGEVLSFRKLHCSVARYFGLFDGSDRVGLDIPTLSRMFPREDFSSPKLDDIWSF